MNENKPSALGIKDKYLAQLHSDFQLLSEIVLSQIKMAATLVHDNHNEEVVSELRRNENNQFAGRYHQREGDKARLFFLPRALDLRRLMSYHDMTISMERVGDLIENITLALEEMDLSMPGFEKYKKPIDKMFVQTDKMLKSALFAFTGVSNEMAYDTIQMDDKVDKLERKIEKQLASDFNGQAQKHSRWLICEPE